MAELLNGLKRTDMCGNLRKNDENREVVVMGFVAKTRDLGNLVFIDLRDRTGIVQLAFDAGVDAALTDKARSVRAEYVVSAKGTVRLRTGKNINENMPTGDVEIDVKDLRILSEAEIPPFVISEKASVGENLALKYRYLELRKSYLQNNLIMRDKITRAARDYLARNGFLEIETPFLGKSTPEGARDYLVPSRIKHGAFYALPQSPQLYKQLLMIAGFDRYYQIARCFRDEDLRANRQPEFTQIDIEMSFVENDEDVMEIAEGMIKDIFAKCKNITFTKPFRRMTWTEAMNRFIRTLLRLYNGVFTEFRQIDEGEIDTWSGYTVERVKELLKRLWQLRVIRYIPSNRSPILFMNEERLPRADLYIAPETYKRRQELMRERFEQMIAYAANEQECRSAVLERYFGEENPAPCGVCDICLARKRAAKAAAREAGTAPGTALPEAAGDAPGSESALREKLLARLARSPADPHRLAAELACPPERLAEAVRELLGKGAVRTFADGRIALFSGPDGPDKAK